jgi:glycosyltransferase involved in cell wall biosynthesis
MRCGVGDYTRQLARALAQDAHLTVAVLTDSKIGSNAADMTFDVLPVISSWRCAELSVIVAAIRKWAPDVVHIQYPTLGYGLEVLPSLLPLALRILGFTVVQTWHEPESLTFLLRSRLIFGFFARAIVPGGLVVVRPDFREKTHWLLRWAFFNKNFRCIPNATAVPAVTLTERERQTIRNQYARPGAYMIAYFGFLYPRKRVELLFEIIDPEDSHIVIMGDGFREDDLWRFPASTFEENVRYRCHITRLAEADRWKDKVTMTGFLPGEEAARVLAAADAAVFPFLDGGIGFNTSVHAAQAQGTFVLTTSVHRRGYESSNNIYFAGENDLQDMQQALIRFRGNRANVSQGSLPPWRSIALLHAELYQASVRKRGHDEG